MVSNVSTVIYPDTNFVTANEEVIMEQEEGNPSIGREREADIGGMESIKKWVVGEEFSEEATGLRMGKWREGNKVSYLVAWGKWSSHFSITNIENVLSAICRKGKAYSTINGYGSAIHPHTGKRPVGQHSDVKAVMTGNFNKNPPARNIRNSRAKKRVWLTHGQWEIMTGYH